MSFFSRSRKPAPHDNASLLQGVLPQSAIVRSRNERAHFAREGSRSSLNNAEGGAQRLGVGRNTGLSFAMDPNAPMTTSLVQRTPVGRSKLLVALFFLVLLGLAARSLWVQVLGRSFYIKEGELRLVRNLELPALRGRILDRNGEVLANSVPAWSIWAAPDEATMNLGNFSRRARLASVLGVGQEDLQRKLQTGKAFVWLKRLVSEETLGEIRNIGLPGVYWNREYRREYPEDGMAVHLLGQTDIDGRGIGGAEWLFDSILSGQAGSRRVIRDGTGNLIGDLGQIDPVNGQNVTLAVDKRLQYLVFSHLHEGVLANRANSGSVVMLDAKTGEVLALANYPSQGNQSSGVKSATGNAAALPTRNIAFSDAFEPGSTIKPFIAALMLESGRLQPQSRIPTNAKTLRVAGLELEDPHGKHEDMMSLTQVIETSNNAGAVTMAMQTEPGEMWEMFSQLGFGQKPPLDFPGLALGKLRPYKSWRRVEQATMSYGYGLSVSLLQLARAYSAFARDGDLIDVSLTRRAPPPRNAPMGVRVFSRKTVAAMRTILRSAIEHGTGAQARQQGDRYSMAGKTGTTYKLDGHGTYNRNLYRSWFVGFAPANDPCIVLALQFDEPKGAHWHGGDVAAPVFGRIVQEGLALLNVRPDLDEAAAPRAPTQATLPVSEPQRLAWSRP